MLKQRILLSVFALLSWLCLGRSQQNLNADIQAARQLCQQFKDQQAIPGLAVAISVNHEMIWAEGFGYSDLESQTPVDPLNTKFRIGSISKSLASAALAKLYENGRIVLDTPIQLYLPDYPRDGGKDRITVRSLGGHLSGIRHYRGDEFLSAKAYGSVSDALDIFKNDSLLAPPGNTYHYSTYGYNLLSAVLERAADDDFLTLMQHLVFDPLAMHNTYPDFTEKIISQRTAYYYRLKDNILNTPYVNNSNKWAGGGFLSTAFDLLKFMHAMADGQYIKPSTWQLLTTAQTNQSGQSTGYGLGWRSWRDNSGHDIIGHSGGSVGGTSHLTYFPTQKIAVVVLTNLSSVQLGQINEQLAALFMD